MINNIIVGGSVFTIDTETQEVSQTRDLGYRYIKARYFVEATGKFIFPKSFKLDPIDVEAGDFIVVFDETNGVCQYVKANMKDAIAVMDNIDKARKEKREKEREDPICEDCVCCD